MKYELKKIGHNLKSGLLFIALITMCNNLSAQTQLIKLGKSAAKIISKSENAVAKSNSALKEAEIVAKSQVMGAQNNTWILGKELQGQPIGLIPKYHMDALSLRRDYNFFLPPYSSQTNWEQPNLTLMKDFEMGSFGSSTRSKSYEWLKYYKWLKYIEDIVQIGDSIWVHINQYKVENKLYMNKYTNGNSILLLDPLFDSKSKNNYLSSPSGSKISEKYFLIQKQNDSLKENGSGE